MTIKESGTVIDGMNIRGCVRVEADDVTIKRSKISCSKPGGAVVRVGSGQSGVLLEDIEIDGQGDSSSCIAAGFFTIRRANIHDCVDGVGAGSESVIEESYVHHLARVPGSHNDAIQTATGSNIVIRNNNLQAYNPTTDDPMNAAYMLNTAIGDVANVEVYGNLMNGGNYTVLGGGGTTNVVFRDNFFGRDFRHGPVSLEGNVSFDNSNVWHDNGEPVNG